MKFAHFADCHLGSWREPLLADLSTIAFEKAVDEIIEEKVDFLLIAGDLFNTSLPSVDSLKAAAKKLKQLKDKNIPVYMIAGSHDFSPSGKTMLDVLENAGLVINVLKGDVAGERLVLKFTADKKTGAKITGMLGKKGGLEKNYYESLDLESLEKEAGYKIFMFHSLLTELKPKSLENVDSEPMSYLPKNFDYYAGGHPHFVFSQRIEGYGIVSYPGPLFPNNFKELEELQTGGFFIVENADAKWQGVKVYDVESIKLNAQNKSPGNVESELKSEIEKRNFEKKIVTLRIEGILESGKPSDINFGEIFELIRQKKAYAVLKNSSSLSSREFEDVNIQAGNTDSIEENLIKEQVSREDIEGTDAVELSRRLMKVLDTCRQEGEAVYTFEKRIKEELDKLMQQ